MILDPAHTPPDAPHLIVAFKPPEIDKDDLTVLSMNLRGMAEYAQEFAECIALFQLCRLNKKGFDLWRAWSMLAPRQAIIAVYNYRMAMDGVIGASRIWGAWPVKPSNSQLGHIKQRFRAEYAHTKELRQTVMHSTERFVNPERKKINQITRGTENFGLKVSPGINLLVTGGTFANDVYSAQWAGKLYNIELSHLAVQRLNQITLDFFSEFQNLELSLTRGPRSE